jgi:hypothetical protein
MDPHAIEAFVRRDRELPARSKAAYWADQFRRDWRSTWNAAQSLLAHARSVHADFPSQRDRELDFAAHLSLRATLDRAANAFTRR